MTLNDGFVSRFGRFGAWIGSGRLTSGIGGGREFAGMIEELGFGTLWVGNADGDLTLPEQLLSATHVLKVATGIVNVWRYEAAAVAARRHQVVLAQSGRLLLGLGVGHAPHIPDYSRPLEKLAAYLDELDAADFPVPRDERVIAALGPRALRLAAARTLGTCPFLVPPEHTSDARERLGDGPLLAPEQKVILTTDGNEARRIARQALAIYLTLPNYLANLRRYGLTDDDFVDGGSDRFVDAVVAWGDDESIRARVQDHLDAGADHVAIHLLDTGPGVDTTDGRKKRTLERWRRVSDLLGGA